MRKCTLIERQIFALPFGREALVVYDRAQAEIGPLAWGFEDLLLDNLDLSLAQAKAIATIYKTQPHVARAIQRERKALESYND